MYSRLQGPTLVSRTIRPPRVAYIVTTLQQCEAVIEVASLTWGGQFFCIVPNVEAVGLTEEWWRILSIYDPDEVISCVEPDELTAERLRSLIARDPDSKQELGSVNLFL